MIDSLSLSDVDCGDIWSGRTPFLKDVLKMPSKNASKARKIKKKSKPSKRKVAVSIPEVLAVPLPESSRKAEDSEIPDVDPVASLSSGESTNSVGSPELVSYAHLDRLVSQTGTSPGMTSGFLAPATFALDETLGPAALDVVTTNMWSDAAYGVVDPMTLALDTYGINELNWQHTVNSAEDHTRRSSANAKSEHGKGSGILHASTGVTDFACHGIESEEMTVAFGSSQHMSCAHSTTKQQRMNEVIRSDAKSLLSQVSSASSEGLKTRYDTALQHDPLPAEVNDLTELEGSGDIEASPRSVDMVESLLDEEDDLMQERNSKEYDAKPHADGLYHCYYEDKEDCTHEPTKLKCNYE